MDIRKLNRAMQVSLDQLRTDLGSDAAAFIVVRNGRSWHSLRTPCTDYIDMRTAGAKLIAKAKSENEALCEST